jgi:uncharacterized protein
LRARLPAPLRPFLDTYEGKAWLGVIPFWMSNVRFRYAPPVPGMSTMAELNVRTYVTIEGKPGVYFFSLDIESIAAVYGARIGFALNYYYASMAVSQSVKHLPESKFLYRSKRLQPPRPAELEASYGPLASEPRISVAGSFEHFAVERYCLYAVRKSGRVLRGVIHHLPWRLQDAQAEFIRNSMTTPLNLDLPERTPALHFARKMDVLIWWPERLPTP